MPTTRENQSEVESLKSKKMHSYRNAVTSVEQMGIQLNVGEFVDRCTRES